MLSVISERYVAVDDAARGNDDGYLEEENVGAESLGLNEEDEAILNGLMKEYPELFESREVQKAFKVCVEAHSDSGHGPLLLDCVGTAKILCELGADDWNHFGGVAARRDDHNFTQRRRFVVERYQRRSYEACDGCRKN